MKSYQELIISACVALIILSFIVGYRFGKDANLNVYNKQIDELVNRDVAYFELIRIKNNTIDSLEKDCQKIFNEYLKEVELNLDLKKQIRNGKN